MASAEMFQIEVESVRRERNFAFAMVRAENRSDCRIDRITFECTFTDKDGKALRVESGRVRLLAPGQSGHDEVGARGGASMHSVSCRPLTVIDAR
jgi:hypothetical protein